MARNNSIPTRVDSKFLQQLSDIKEMRIKMGKDKILRPTRTSRITLAMTRHPLFNKIKEDIIISDLP